MSFLNIKLISTSQVMCQNATLGNIATVPASVILSCAVVSVQLIEPKMGNTRLGSFCYQMRHNIQVLP